MFVECSCLIFNYCRAQGISADRLASAPQTPWIDHIVAKTSIDMVLDTFVKTGHTTGLDGWWAGVPTVALGGGSTMPARYFCCIN
jgi:predicted O-linked N-acetylglucosamine transferase (SPINDLY family)